MNLEEEERVILHKFDEYCQKKSINLPLDINDKKKLIQMIIILEKLQNNNPQRYISTLKRMGLDKILNQNNQNNEISIFDAILAFYSASITYSTDGGNTNNKQQQSSDDIFEYIKNNQWDSISKLVKKNSHVVTTLHPTYGLPLHLICSAQLSYCPSLDAVSNLLMLFPSALTTIAPCGMYPLHMWLVNWRHFEAHSTPKLVEEIFHLLLQTDTRVAALNSKDINDSQSADHLLLPPEKRQFEIFSQYKWNGMLPIHIACRNSLPLTTVLPLINTYRQGIREIDDHGLTALHWLLVSPYGSRPEVVGALLAEYNEVSLMADETFGSLPLHLACMSSDTPIEVIFSLCQSFPQGCSLQDRHGYLPLHYACSSLLPYKVIHNLLELYPEGCKFSTTTTGYILPLHLYVTSGGEDVNIIHLIAKNDLPKLPQDGSTLCTGGRSWVYLVSTANRTNSNYLISAVDWIVREVYQENGSKGVYQLAYVLNEQNQILIESCSPEIQQFFHQYLLLCDRYFLLPSESIVQSSSSLTVTAYDYLASNFYRKCYLFCIQDNLDSRSDISSLDESYEPLEIHKNTRNTPDFYRADSYQPEIRKGGMTSTEFYEFVQLVGFNFLTFNGKINEIAILELYSTLLQSSNGNITEEFLVNYCEEYFQYPRKIKLKFSRNLQQIEYEYLLREKELLGSHYVIKLLDIPSNEILLNGLRHHYFHPIYNLNQYQSLISMAYYEYNLDYIFRYEQPNTIQVLQIMKQIGYALLDCHERGILHGNLNMKNILKSSESSSSSSSSSYILSNFYNFHENNLQENFHFHNFDSNLPTTGYLPPEAFLLINNKNSPNASSSLRISAESSFEKANRFSWLSDDSRDLSMTYQILPLVKYLNKEEKSITSEVIPSSGQPNIGQLNVGLDIWAYGMIFYALLTGDHFFPVDRNENLSKPEDLIPLLVSMKIEAIETKIKKKVPDLLASNLLLQLLHPNMNQRINSFQQILSHPYFQDQSSSSSSSLVPPESENIPNSDQIPDSLTNIPSSITRLSSSQYDRYSTSNSTKFQSRKYRGVKNFPSDVLTIIKTLNIHNIRKNRTGIKGTYHPTSFLLFNRKLTFPLKSISLDHNENLTGSGGGSGIVPAVPDVPPLVMSRVQRWINKLYNYFILIDQYNTTTTTSLNNDILLALNDICNENELYLYLIDEITLEPIISSSSSSSSSSSNDNIFPILITHPSIVIPTIIPLLRETYKMICSSRYVENMGHCFGYPLDLIPFHWIDAIQHIIGSYDTYKRHIELINWKNYLEKNFKISSFSSASSQEDSESCLSLAINHFIQFLDENDPYQQWCGLIKIYLNEEFHCWTKENIQLFLQTSTSTSNSTSQDVAVVPNELKSDSCSEESDLNRLHGVLFPPVMPLPADNNILRTPSPSKKVGFIFEVSSEPNNSQTMNIESSTHQSHTGTTTGTPTIIQTPITTFPLMKGRIYKQPTSISANRSFNIMKQWTKRYMILESMTYILKYGVSEAALCSSNGIKGSIQLQVGMNCIKGKKNKCFELYLGNSCILRSIAETDDERDRWIHAIQTAIQDLEALVRRQGSK